MREDLLKKIGIEEPESELTTKAWLYLSGRKKLSEEFIREFKDKVDWVTISEYQKLSQNFIREFQDKVDWEWVSENQTLDEEFIREFRDKVHWGYISSVYHFTDEFLLEFKNEIWWNLYLSHQEAPFSIIKKFMLKTKIKDISNIKSNHLNQVQKVEIEKLLSFKSLFVNTEKEKI
jgi:hypothetical protein